MIKNSMRIFLVFVLLAPWWQASHAADTGGPKLNEELSKQEQIIRSRGDQRPEGYVIDRSLVSYTETLNSEFDRTLATLSAQERWLDIGAGRGQAVLDYFGSRFDMMHPKRDQSRKKAQAVAISIEDRRTPLWSQTAARLDANQIQYFINKRLREYSLKELGQFQVITDVIGGFSYTQNLSLFMEKVLDFLELNGSFYTVLQDVHAETGTNKPFYDGSPFLTEIADAGGSEVRVCSWLKRITCAEVTCEFKPAWNPPIEVYRIRKVCDNVTVPALVSSHFEAGTPPERGFRLEN